MAFVRRFANPISLLAMCALFAGCSAEPEWTGFVYPDADNLTVSAEIGRFDTFEQCQAASIKTLGAFAAISEGTFECGRRCKPSATGLQVCAETRDG